MTLLQNAKSIFVCVLCACVLISGSPYVELAFAQSEPSPGKGHGRQGSVAIQYLGGFVGGMLGYTAFEYYVHYFCATPFPRSAEPLSADDIEICKSFYRGTNRGTVYPAVIFAGSSLGIAATGLLTGTQGNYIAMMIGSLSGAFSGAAIWSDFIWNIIVYFSDTKRIAELKRDENTPTYWLRAASAMVAFIHTNIAEFEENVKLFVPIVIAVLLGVIGFNIGV